MSSPLCSTWPTIFYLNIKGTKVPIFVRKKTRTLKYVSFWRYWDLLAKQHDRHPQWPGLYKIVLSYQTKVPNIFWKSVKTLPHLKYLTSFSKEILTPYSFILSFTIQMFFLRFIMIQMKIKITKKIAVVKPVGWQDNEPFYEYSKIYLFKTPSNQF